MRDSELRFAQLKYKVRNEQEPDKLWKLDKEQIEFLVQMGYLPVVELYQIITKPTQCRERVMKEINHAYKNGHKKMYKKLDKYQIQLLTAMGVEYIPFKYRIIKA